MSDRVHARRTRRAFLASTIRGGVSLFTTSVVAGVSAGAGSRPASAERFRLGVIGAGQRGFQHVRALIAGSYPAQVVAVSDVYEPHARRAVEAVGGRCKAYKDYRHLLDRTDIDAVIIATPDHWHTLVGVEACRAGKDVYCEAPLTRTIDEALHLAEAAENTDVIFQTGAPMRTGSHVRAAREMVRRNMLPGKLRRIEIGCGKGPACGPEPPQAPPPDLDWNMWLGPAPWADYTPKRCLQTFRWFYDYAGGTLTDTGVHYVDLALWTCPDVGVQPVVVEPVHAEFPTTGLFETAVEYRLVYRFENGLEWIISSDLPGLRFCTDAGWLLVNEAGLQADNADLLHRATTIRAKTAHETRDDRLAWLDCIRTRRRPPSDAQAGCRAAILCHLGNIALRTGRRFRWDPARSEITDVPLLNRWLTTPYRAPWHL